MKLHDTGVYLVNGVPQTSAPAGVTEADAKKGTIAYGILKAHNTGDSMQDLRMKFDSMTSHDITYVGIIQTARASGMTEFPLPYVMTNCHNSLCAVGGTINEDDHQFALSAAHKYGGIYVPPNMAVIHSYNREMMSGCGRMILGSDSHTRYGALGTNSTATPRIKFISAPQSVTKKRCQAVASSNFWPLTTSGKSVVLRGFGAGSGALSPLSSSSAGRGLNRL